MARVAGTGARGRLWLGTRMGAARGVPPCEPTGLCETGGFGAGRGGEELCDGGGGELLWL
jgi:hypothetical protein